MELNPNLTYMTTPQYSAPSYHIMDRNTFSPSHRVLLAMLRPTVQEPNTSPAFMFAELSSPHSESPPLYPTLSPVHTLTFDLFQIHFILPFHLLFGLPSVLFSKIYEQHSVSTI
jgi:hypothetical protein